MNIKHIQILSDALDDLLDGKEFYEEQGKGVGNYFWDCLLSDIESLLIFGGVHSKMYGFHRMLSKRFPYAIYYDVENEIAYILAVLPMKKDPFWIEAKVNQTKKDSGLSNDM